MDQGTKDSPCKEWQDGSVETLQAELDHLRQHLSERDAHIVSLEAEFVKSNEKTTDLEEQVATWREKYERLYDSHKRVQKLNQILEDKLLQMVDRMKGEKSQLTKDIATLSVRLAESKHNVSLLHKENERYKNDMNLAIQLLQCKPDNFVSHKLDNLPVDTQARVSQYVMSKTKANSPPTSATGKTLPDPEPVDLSEYDFNISASLMAKILEDSMQDTVTKHCDTCTCMKNQSNPFSYNETHYSVATQTLLNGDAKNSYCLNCNADLHSFHSNSIKSTSPRAVKLVNERTLTPAPNPIFLVQPNTNNTPSITEKIVKENDLLNDKIKSEDKLKIEASVQREIVNKIGEELRELRNNLQIEPSTHHRLCDRTKTASYKGSDSSLITDNIINKDILDSKEKAKQETPVDNNSLRKNSHSSTGAISRTSSIAKSTASTHKSNTHVGPGPRFCSLRVQAGSKNILLDNAQPDVPPVLYRRQSKCTEEELFKLADGADNFILPDKKDDLEAQSNVVIESTLVDVHVDSTSKNNSTENVNRVINPVIMNVSSSPLQPQKTHSFSTKLSGSSDNHVSENNNSLPIQNAVNTHVETITKQAELEFNKNFLNTEQKMVDNNDNKDEVTTENTNMTNNQGIKVFNFDQYEQSKITNQFNSKRSLRKIDMSQLHSLENTKISKDLSPLTGGDVGSLKSQLNLPVKPSLSGIVNVYPNLTQTQLKVNNDSKKVQTEPSTSSLSSDDSAALLQKQQLLRVAEWVEQNLEQQNIPLANDDELVYQQKLARRDSKTKKHMENLEIVHKMPHPVTKYSYNREDIKVADKVEVKSNKTIVNHIIKETIFPVDNDNSSTQQTLRESTQIVNDNPAGDAENNLFKYHGKSEKEISAEDLARMEYNVKKFLLSGCEFETITKNENEISRCRRTSSKTETDL